MKTSAIAGIIAATLFVVLVIFVLVRKSSKSIAGKLEAPTKQTAQPIAQPPEVRTPQIPVPEVSNAQATDV